MQQKYQNEQFKQDITKLLIYDKQIRGKQSKQSTDCYQRAKTVLSYYSVRLSVPKVIS